MVYKRIYGQIYFWMASDCGIKRQLLNYKYKHNIVGSGMSALRGCGAMFKSHCRVSNIIHKGKSPDYFTSCSFHLSIFLFLVYVLPKQARLSTFLTSYPAKLLLQDLRITSPPKRVTIWLISQFSLNAFYRDHVLLSLNNLHL